VTATTEASTAGEIGYFLRSAASLEIAYLVRDSDDGVGVADVDPLGIGTVRVEGDSEWLVQPGGEDLTLFGAAGCVDSAENANLVTVAFGYEVVAIWRRTDQAGTIEALGIKLHLEAGRNLGPCVLGASDDVLTVIDGFILLGSGKIGDRDFVSLPGLLPTEAHEDGAGSVFCDRQRAPTKVIGAAVGYDGENNGAQDETIFEHERTDASKIAQDAGSGSHGLEREINSESRSALGESKCQ